MHYYDIQQRLRRNRRDIFIKSCLLCLFIGFMAGMAIYYPKAHVVVSAPGCAFIYESAIPRLIHKY